MVDKVINYEGCFTFIDAFGQPFKAILMVNKDANTSWFGATVITSFGEMYTQHAPFNARAGELEERLTYWCQCAEKNEFQLIVMACRSKGKYSQYRIVSALGTILCSLHQRFLHPAQGIKLFQDCYERHVARDLAEMSVSDDAT